MWVSDCKKPLQKEGMTLINYSVLHSVLQPNDLACKFITNGSRKHVTYKELDIKARAIAAYLEQHDAQGERAILFLPPGLEYVYSFLGSLYAGVVAVPTYVMRNKRRKKNLQAIIEDSGAKFVITSQKLVDNDLFSDKKILLIEELDDKLAQKWQRKVIRPDRVAFLQYTSGSTGKPKGVMVTHENIIANVRAIDLVFGNTTNRKLLSWLPPHHDMGLIGGILFPIYSGFTAILMPPAMFSENPISWLKVISEEKVTHSPAPNFAYNLCVEAIKNSNESIKLDLSSWKVAFNGAEHVSAHTVENFTKAFSCYGLSSLTMCPGYGMAEATLVITATCTEESLVKNKLDKAALEQGKIVGADTGSDRKSVELVGCGRVIPGHELIIVDPVTRKQLSSNMIGEIWVCGASVTKGYWNKPELTEANFCAEPEGGSDRKYFRTGDLGFLDERDQLFITGRIKDLIIVQGRNIYPQDIEESVCDSNKEIAPHSSAAFGLSVEGTEHLVVACEVDRHTKNYDEIFECILKSVLEDHEIMPYRVILIKQTTLPKTSSGKIQRSYCRKLLEEGELQVIAEWNQVDSGHEAYIPPSNELETKLRDIFAGVLRLQADSVGINDDFFKLGGSSASAIKLVNKINNDTSITISVADIFKHKNIRKLTENIENYCKEIITIPTSNVKENKQVLSFAQERLFFIHKYEDGTNAYNIPAIYKLNDNTNIKQLINSIHSIVKRQDVLRSTIKEDKDNIYQVINSVSDKYLSKITVKNSRGLNKAINKDINYIFNLGNEFPIRVRIYSDTKEKYVSIVIHHIAFDGWSAGIFLDELHEFYNHYNNNSILTLPKLDIQYKDFALWQKKYLTGKVLSKQLSYWKKLLDGYENINLPTDYPRPKEVDYIGSTVNFTLKKQLSIKLRNTAKQLGVSLYTLLLASYYLMLKAYSNQDDIVIGIPVANRHYPQIQNLIGFFVNSLPIRINIKSKEKLREFVKLLSDQIIEAQLQQDLPFEKLVDELKVEKDTSRHPIFQVMFGLQSFCDNKGKYKDNILLPYDKEESKYDTAKFDLETFIDDSDEVLRGGFNYRVSLYKKETIEGFISTYKTILRQVGELIQKPDTKIHSLSYLNKPEQELILVSYNNTEVAFPNDKTIAQLFEKQAARTPDNIAVVYEGIRLTYKELNEGANRLANYLIKNYSITPDTLIALFLDRSEHMIIAILATLKAGGAYVPMDPEYPDERIRYILEDTSSKLIIANKKYEERLKDIKANTQTDSNKELSIISVDDISTYKLLNKQPTKNPITGVKSTNLAYVIYTSGTTGKPKGVMIEHKSVVNYIANYKLDKIIELNDKGRCFFKYRF